MFRNAMMVSAMVLGVMAASARVPGSEPENRERQVPPISAVLPGLPTPSDPASDLATDPASAGFYVWYRYPGMRHWQSVGPIMLWDDAVRIESNFHRDGARAFIHNEPARPV